VKIAFHTRTPLAGMPWRTAMVCNPFSEDGGWFRCIADRLNYGGPRCYPEDVPSSQRNQIFHEADLIIVSSYMSEKNPEYLGKPVARHYSTEKTRWINKNPSLFDSTVVAQYQARFAPDLDVLPNCIPIDDPMFKPAEKPADRVVIVYTPTSRTDGGWASKGWAETTKVLSNVQHAYKDRVEVVLLENRPYKEVMRARRHAHIVIDECVTGSYHSCALEGLSCGAVTFCWMDRETERAFRRLWPDSDVEIPFMLSTLPELESRLVTLIENRDMLLWSGGEARKWMIKNYATSWQASMWINWHRKFLERQTSK